ncbi:MAG: carboxypeptidase regulatory-like domain-containing protein [Planctomycetota bacterium]|nr:carboxypeptidase regulatory-like domain-containing protein [Planctomycetota bacterium]
MGKVAVLLLVAAALVATGILLTQEQESVRNQPRERVAPDGGEPPAPVAPHSEAARGRELVAGIVTEGGRPLANVLIVAWGVEAEATAPHTILERAFGAQSRPAPVGRTTTDDRGRFTLHGLPVKRVEVRAQVAPPRYSTAVVAGTRTLAARRMRLEVRSGSKLRGRIKSSIPDLTVSAKADLEQQRWSWGPVPVTQGAFEIEGAPAAVITVTVHARGVLQAAYGVRSPAPEPVVLVFPPADSAAVEGTVTAGGEPVQGARVGFRTGSVLGSFEPPVHGTAVGVTGKDGRYRLEGLVPGPSRGLIVHAEGFPVREMPLAGTWLEPGATLQLDVKLQPGGVVHGRVVDTAGSPIEAATVTGPASAGESIRNLALPARTDAAGRFHIVVPEGPGKLLVRAPGFVAKFAQGHPYGVQEGESAEVEIAMIAALTVRGKVVGPDGGPVAAAVVFAHRPGEELDLDKARGPKAVTADDGSFELGGLRPSRKWAVSAFATGLRSRESTLESSPQHVMLEMVRTAVLGGRVLDESDQPVEGRPVRLVRPNASVLTGRNGRFRLEGLLPGTYGVALIEGSDIGEPVMRDLRAGEVVDDLVLRSPGRVAFSGVVADEAGRPLPGIQVTVQSTNASYGSHGVFYGDWGTTRLTDAFGAFRLFGLHGGDLDYRFELNQIPVEGTWKAPRDGMRLVYAREQHKLIEGRLVDSEGRDVPSARLYVYLFARNEEVYSGFEHVGYKTTDAHQGKFRLQAPLNTSALTVTIYRAYDEAGRDLGIHEFKVEKLELPDGPVTLTLPAAMHFRGRVVDVQGRGVEGVTVEIAYLVGHGHRRESRIENGKFEWPYSADRSGRTDVEGRFEIQRMRKEPFYVRTLGHPDHAWTEPLRVLDSSLEEEIIVKPAGSIRGRVFGPDKEPIEGVRVSLADKSYGDAPTATTDVDGRFRIGSLVGGAVTLNVLPGGEYGAERSRPYLWRKLEGVRVGTEDLQVRLERGGRIEGELVRPDGKPVMEGLVWVRRVGQEERYGDYLRSAAHLDPGRFSIGPLPMGRYELWLEPSVREKLSVFMREPVRVEVPGPRVAIRVEACWTVKGRVAGPSPPGCEVRWLANEPLVLRGDVKSYFTRSDTGSIYRGKLTVYDVREESGMLYAYKDGDDRYALLGGVRRGGGPFTLRFQSGKSIAGRVEADQRHVRLRVSQGRLERLFSTTKEGEFRVTGLPAGMWLLEQATDEPSAALEVEAGDQDVVFQLQ